MKSSDTIGHSPVLCWYRGKTAGAREQNPRNIERGRQGVKNLAASVFFHTMGRGAEPQGLFSFHPVLPHCTRARRAGPIRVVPRASYADGVALGAPENHNPLPRLGPFWKINLCGASEVRLFSTKNQKFSGVFRYAFSKSGKAIPPKGGIRRKGDEENAKSPTPKKRNPAGRGEPGQRHKRRCSRWRRKKGPERPKQGRPVRRRKRRRP